ncbi:hypothetical protein TNCV_4654651 [Trichonephila clavipes]|nr:hypothetical protein TNCV_4654651 [Trichonephila clavipes]
MEKSQYLEWAHGTILYQRAQQALQVSRTREVKRLREDEKKSEQNGRKENAEETKGEDRRDGKGKGQRKSGENGRKEKGEETKERVGERESGARLVWRKGLSPEIGVKKTMNAGGVENGNMN